MSPEEYEKFVLTVLNVNIAKLEKDREVVEWIENELQLFISDDNSTFKKYNWLQFLLLSIGHARIAKILKITGPRINSGFFPLELSLIKLRFLDFQSD